MKRLRITLSGKGFTIIESMIAMFFLAYIVGQMAMLSIYASRTSNAARRLTRANLLADEALEKSRNTAYNNLQLANAALGEACATTGTVATCTSTLDGIFTRVRTVSPFDKNGNPVALISSNQSDVDVAVSFNDASGNAQTIRVASVVSRY
jgi:Tfp pilus assembly protein PilV